MRISSSNKSIVAANIDQFFLYREGNSYPQIGQTASEELISMAHEGHSRTFSDMMIDLF
ncbi:hypothetical protein [Fulvivirga sedimenti]|uniref:hypothetical protein n=1 Tax=Fulvivirga sedimenti TaxID=2879465 RepID=UPI003B82C88A